MHEELNNNYVSRYFFCCFFVSSVRQSVKSLRITHMIQTPVRVTRNNNNNNISNDSNSSSGSSNVR